ncbi:MAG: hypothetical protein DWQ34_19040 [Planctomycetota bacterium]|nr:MAG: hypothetical protein DWQ34_19040 [Planctomycetota bacterium]REK24331.1 MAG: hypothetical protein DWQ41_15010 [Planctomycetota bacterium]REK34646.1 MAG: hypothetical protein DWQ45_13185 [Planctomycetota bacterium]
MRFHVRTLSRADRDVHGILSYIAEHSKEGATAWARAYDNALARLEKSADSFPFAIENEYVDFEVREILFKTRRGLVYRALFTIRETTVYVLHVRGPGQNLLDENELRRPK